MSSIVATRPMTTTQQTVRELSWVYTKRFARHPLLLLGIILCALTTAANANQANTAYMTLGFLVALFIGMPSMVVAYRLTRMTDGAAEVADAAPSAIQSRTTGLLVACLVPAAIGAGFVLVAWFAAEAWSPPAWVYAGFDRAEIVAMFFSEMVIAPFGAAVLGIAAGRWMRFPAAIVLLVVGVLGWVLLSLSQVATSDIAKLATSWVNALRLFSPYTFWTFQEATGADDFGQMALPGSPFWYGVWQLLLCALAVTAALLWRADGLMRRRLLGTGVVLTACAVAAYVLALTVDADHAGLYHPDGTIERAAEQ